MKVLFIVILFKIALISSTLAQDVEKPIVTVKVGTGLSIVQSIYYATYKDIVYYMPSINAGVLIKNWVYLGGFYTQKSNKTFPEKRLTVGEIGVPVLKRFIVGLSFGKEYYWAPSDGGAQVVVTDNVPAYGGLVEYNIMKYLSMGVRYSYVQKTNLGNGGNHGPSHYINVGVTGNLPIHRKKN